MNEVSKIIVEVFKLISTLFEIDGTMTTLCQHLSCVEISLWNRDGKNILPTQNLGKQFFPKTFHSFPH